MHAILLYKIRYFNICLIHLYVCVFASLYPTRGVRKIPNANIIQQDATITEYCRYGKSHERAITLYHLIPCKSWIILHYDIHYYQNQHHANIN